MFKKTEDSEWSRFSRALAGQSKGPAEEAPAREQPPEPVAVVREAPVQSVPVPAPAPVTQPRPAAPQSYGRPHAAPSPQEVDEVETILGVHTHFDGTLNCESSMRIRGSAQGEITCARSVIIEETARVNAKVTAANATVAGKLDGSIVCDGRLEILATGQVTGELAAGVLIIQEGAFFEGHLKMKERKAEDRPAPETAPARRFGAADVGVS